LNFLFPELKAYLDSYPAFESLSGHELSRVPALIVIYKNLLKWRLKFEKDDDQIPQNFKEKSQLSLLIKDEMEYLREIKASKPFESESGETALGASLELENFEEAVKMLNKVFLDSHKVPESLRRLLDEVNPNEQGKSSFWVMLAALKQFIEKYNCVPLRGTIPDMNCGSEQYIRLQNIYKNTAKQDVDKMLKLTQKVPKLANVIISDKEVQLICKNARYLTVIRTSPIHAELTGESLQKLAASRLQNGAEEEGTEFDELRYYLLMRLVDRFYSKHNRFPGQRDDEVESDISELKREFREFSSDLHCNVFIKDEFIHEICRYGGCELHSISAFIGGCAAHEAIKLMTGQYVPINNTFVYNGLTCTTFTYTL